jgi:hypothetical protein
LRNISTTASHLLFSYNVAAAAISKTYARTWQPPTRCNQTFIVPDPSRSSVPQRATIAAREQARKEHPMFDVFMVALGLGFFLVAVGYAYACERRL